MGRGTDKGDEFPPHGAPKAKDHDLTITPRIAARSGHLRRLRVKSGGDDWDDATAMSALPTTMRAAATQPLSGYRTEGSRGKAPA
jgi:hypothetical protein